jgi:hypothetical protein
MAVTGFNNEEGKMAQQLVGTKYLPFYFESERPVPLGLKNIM